MDAMSETFPEEDPLGPGPSPGTTVIERTEQRQELEPGYHERYAHYVLKERIMSSARSLEPVIALCDKVRVPGRDPNKYPVCPTCKQIYEALQAPRDNDSGSSGPDGR